MKTFRSAFLILIIFFAVNVHAQTFTYDFITDDDNWSGDFADYPITDSVFYELAFIRTTLPSPLNTSKYALKITGNNHSDDLFMFIKRKISGLLPLTRYQLSIAIELASDAPTHASGVGGAPGEGVTIKAGASVIEPLKINSDGFYLMNIDKGNQGYGGVDMDTIGNMGVSDTTSVFTLINRSNITHLFMVTTNADGEVWVCIGTDSGYESTTTIYYNEITLVFSEASRVENLNPAPSMIIFPNPATDKLKIKSREEIDRFELYNILGRQVYLFKNTGIGQLTDVDVSGFQKGTYAAKIYSHTHLYTKKIIID